MAFKQTFVSLAAQKVDLRSGNPLVQAFRKGCGQDDVSQKRGLYDQEFPCSDDETGLIFSVLQGKLLQHRIELFVELLLPAFLGHAPELVQHRDALLYLALYRLCVLPFQ